ncbi:unnamed protein product [Gongylonema pulchrum]|uniref:Uncharacterized protein n=1 Tax=Gongylonema pulchrum TaxID=637853 RepID=A0A183E016_9BILA|nr:unnamed protein product [Gongylonema pulchrum]
MAYRTRQSDPSDTSSDEEGPSICKSQRMDEPMEGQRLGSKAAQMWTDFLTERSLLESFSGSVEVCPDGSRKVERGVESYALPEKRADFEEKDRVML